jgi:hypothetical protein
MGDSYTLELNCAHCGRSQEAYYAESSGSTAFKCEFCGKVNGIEMGFYATKNE